MPDVPGPEALHAESEADEQRQQRGVGRHLSADRDRDPAPPSGTRLVPGPRSVGADEEIRLTYGELTALIADAKVFARIEPTQKTIIVEQLTAEAAKHEWRELPWVQRFRDTVADQHAKLEAMGTDEVPLRSMFVHKTLAGYLRPDDVLVFDGGDYSYYGRAYLPARSRLAGCGSGSRSPSASPTARRRRSPRCR